MESHATAPLVHLIPLALISAPAGAALELETLSNSRVNRTPPLHRLNTHYPAALCIKVDTSASRASSCPSLPWASSWFGEVSSTCRSQNPRRNQPSHTIDTARTRLWRQSSIHPSLRGTDCHAWWKGNRQSGIIPWWSLRELKACENWALLCFYHPRISCLAMHMS